MVDRRSPAAPLPVHLDVELKGVVLPTWVAVTLSIVAALSCGVVLLAVLMFRQATESLGKSQTASQSAIAREMRILDVHLQDVQNILIRNGMARREDFADHSAKNLEGEKQK